MLDDVYERHDTIDNSLLGQRFLLLDRKGGGWIFALLYCRIGLVRVMALENRVDG